MAETQSKLDHFADLEAIRKLVEEVAQHAQTFGGKIAQYKESMEMLQQCN